MLRNQKWVPYFILLAAFFSGFLAAHLKNQESPENARFERFTTNLFQEEVTSNTITLHYTLAAPSSYGIHTYPVTLGSVSSYNNKETTPKHQKHLKTIQNKLNTFDYSSLSLKNQITYDTLKLTLETESAYAAYPLLTEPLSPTLGIQAQLPVLLAEYTFRSKKDVTDYLSLLKEIPIYFNKILAFEQKKSKEHLFMSDNTANRIIDQCLTFAKKSRQNFLISVFHDKLRNCSFLSDQQKKSYEQQNQELILQKVIPAYQTLAHGLKKLLGTGVNPYGLSHFPNGKEYYLTLIRSTTGIYDSIEDLTDRLYHQLHSDYLQIRRLLTAHPDLPQTCQDDITAQSIAKDPTAMLQHLQKQMSYDFPAITKPEYSVKYVHKDLEPYLSPAFYLTPPIDLLSPNTIYINNYNEQKGLSLYATLAHEGFPGHLYQTLYFSQTNPAPIRHLLSNSGFVEGWATYIESYAYQYAPTDYETGQYMALNRSFYLCLYSLLDIYIHYYGWTLEDATEYLNTLGITDESSQKEIYQILVEDPANYLKYCLGSLSIQDLKEKTAQLQGNNFNCKEFHKALLSIGPAPFPVLEKFLFYYL